MRTLVIGGSGQVGGALVEALQARGDVVTATWRSVPLPGGVPCDLADAPAVERLVRDTAPEAIFCAAGATWVDGCEQDPAWARAANVEGPLVAARAAPAVPFVFFSSDYVFDGAAGPYGEDATPHPLQEYGRTKLAGEAAVQAAAPRALIIRTVGVFGPERQGKNFVHQLWKRLRAGERMRVPSDQWGTPTFGPDLARAVVQLVAGGHTGLFHVAGPDACTRIDFARAACAVLGLDAGLLDPVTTAELGQPAARPLRGGLRCDALARCGIAPPRALGEGLLAMRAVLAP